jgi:hypothetical protein
LQNWPWTQKSYARKEHVSETPVCIHGASLWGGFHVWVLELAGGNAIKRGIHVLLSQPGVRIDVS